MSEAIFEGVAIIELLGHRRLVGQVREVELFGGKVCRIDVALPGGRTWPQFYEGAAMFGLTPATAEQLDENTRRTNQETLIRLKLAPPVEVADFETWLKAEAVAREERYGRVVAERRLALGHGNDDEEDEDEEDEDGRRGRRGFDL